jgi:hypothetical protein
MQLPESPEQVLSSQLGPKEKLLWYGRPRQGIFLSPKDAYLIPFSLMWGGFAIFWEYGVVNSNAPLFFELWGIPFVLIGLYLIAGRFFVDAKRRSKTYYGLTNERVVIVSGNVSSNVKSLQLRTLSDVSLAERADGNGTITFGPTPPWWSGGGGWPGTSRNSSPAFESISGAREVFERIRLAQKEV